MTRPFFFNSSAKNRSHLLPLGQLMGKELPWIRCTHRYDFDSHIADGEMSGVKVCAAGHYPSQGTSVSGSFLRRRAGNSGKSGAKIHKESRIRPFITTTS